MMLSLSLDEWILQLLMDANAARTPCMSAGAAKAGSTLLTGAASRTLIKPR
ncbi:hypothetical protein [Herbaspirillum huttiense]|uniref:hypothetical protein n=1 Tax=Herbaspirillum huttiense TaxID=863372 RepID=UPI0039AF597C